MAQANPPTVHRFPGGPDEMYANAYIIEGEAGIVVIDALLVEAVGATALDAGGLEHAAYLEAMGAVVIRALFGGADPTTSFQLAVADGIRVGTG